MPKKPRKAPAKAPVVHDPVEPGVAEPDIGEPAVGEDDEPLRFDVDQPPVTGVTGRPSVYSEWINSPPRPSARSAWLNSPAPASAATPKAAAPAAPAAPVSPPAPLTPTPIPMRRARPVTEPAGDSASPTSGKGRSRRATSARRLTAADRLSVDPETLQALAAEATLADVPLPQSMLDAETERVAELPRPMQAAPPASSRRATAAPAPIPAPAPMPPLSLAGAAQSAKYATNATNATTAAPNAPDLPASAARRATGARLPATLGETTRRVAVPPGGTSVRQPTPQRRTLQPAGRGYSEVANAARVRSDLDEPAAGRGPVEAEVALAMQETAAGLPALTEEPGPPAEASVLIRGTARPPRPTTGRIVPRRMRPPSILTQAVVALATVIVLMGALAISSPLGYGAAISGTFQAYANAVVWIPTPTPTATATPVPRTYQSIPASPGTQAVVDEIKSIFGQYAQGALNISHCESGWDSAAYNPYPVGNSHAEGVFQILYPSTWNTTSYASRSPYDYDANIRAAWQIFSRDGYSWREWECKPY